MDYKQLKFFRKICEEKSINRAAQKLYISQQALSKSVARLEEEIGAPLFVRTPGGVRLTPTGQLLEQRAGEYLEEHDDILRQLRAVRTGTHLRIGYFMGLLQELPAGFFARFMDRHPDLPAAGGPGGGRGPEGQRLQLLSGAGAGGGLRRRAGADDGARPAVPGGRGHHHCLRPPVRLLRHRAGGCAHRPVQRAVQPGAERGPVQRGRLRHHPGCWPLPAGRCSTSP